MPEHYERREDLKDEATGALEDGDLTLARQLAQEWLAADSDPTAWHYGNTIHNANQLLGLISVREGDLDSAKRYLLAAGNTPGSPQLDSFGPQMHLAQTLLSRGERDIVLEYLELVTRFWGMHKPTSNLLFVLLFRYNLAQNTRKLARWKAAIRAGEQPRLNRVGPV